MGAGACGRGLKPRGVAAPGPASEDTLPTGSQQPPLAPRLSSSVGGGGGACQALGQCFVNSSQEKDKKETLLPLNAQLTSPGVLLLLLGSIKEVH